MAEQIKKTPMNDRETAIARLEFDFGYRAEAIAAYMDAGNSYLELKNCMLHAYAAKVPLEKIIEMRKLYGWAKINYQLGLSAQDLWEANIEHQADRMEKFMGLDRKIVIEWMHKGYGVHQVKRASFIARHIDMPLKDILALKTRQIKWPEVAVSLGLRPEDCRE
ncbi:MAG: hypothetical protein Q4D21_01960 [Phascolarctobacterium sp.]|nr:hypothetical protein [Phascolarctobacterium sp.]